MPSAARVHEAARAFDRAADDYERGRPEYPPEAVRWLVDELGIDASKTVLDLAAGTGKLTRQLIPTGARIIAVEPVEGMRRKLEEGLPGVTVLDGTAEAIPLPDASVDAVTVAQAFHWFRGEEALREIHRVLKAVGGLGLLWNLRDHSVEWVAKLGEITERHRRGVPTAYDSEAWKAAFAETHLFTPVEQRLFGFAQELEEDGLLARVASISFIAALPAERREQVLGEVRELVESHPATRGKSDLALPYRTGVFVFARR